MINRIETHMVNLANSIVKIYIGPGSGPDLVHIMMDEPVSIHLPGKQFHPVKQILPAIKPRL
jgi:hypothetical protein